MKNQAVVLCCLLLLLHLGLCRNYARTLRKWKGGAENDITKKDQTDSADVTISDETSAQSLGDIQADSLGENNQVTFDANAEREAIAHELEDSGPVFSHDASVPDSEKETSDTNDMSHYDSEDINLVGNSRHKTVKAKPVRLPSLTEEGKIDTFVTKSNSTDEDDSPKIIKPNKENLSSSYTDSSSSDENLSTDSGRTEMTTTKPKLSKHRSIKAKNTKHRSFASEVGSSNIFDLPDISSPDNDDILPKSSKLLLGESDDTSPEKLRKTGERLTMFYDRDARKKKQSLAHAPAVIPKETSVVPTVNVKGGQIVGGQISGGNIFGGDIEGGFIAGGTIRGGTVRGGRMSQGLMDGGLLLDGDIAGGYLHNGTVKGGLIRGGNITGGTITGGEILGGHVSAGFVSGGVLKKGGVEGGVLRGGTIDGGTLKGGVMESGQLLGGVVRNGRVTGGTILGGEVLGGEVGEGVVIRGGRINGTVTVGHKMQSDFNKHVNKLASPIPSRLPNMVNQNRPYLQGQPNPQKPTGPRYNLNLQNLQFAQNAPRPYSSLSSQETIQGDVGGRVNSRPLQSQTIPAGRPNGVSSGNIASDAVVINRKNNPRFILLSNFSNDREQIKRNYQPNGFYNRQSYTDPSYVFPNNLYTSPKYGYQATSTSGTQYQATNSYSSPLATSAQTSRQNGININQFVKQVSNSAGFQRSSTGNDKGDVKPTYHWILNQIKNGKVTGVPSGRKFVAKGGIRLNRASIGFDGTATYMDGGSYAGTCVSDPALCPRGLSVEMTVKVDPAATMYRAPRYILDSGASSFNSRGVALYTMDNKLRADVAVKDKAYCLVVPLVTDKWQDVVLTYHQNGELNMYINCKLVATTESDDQCINCHTSGCHNTDANTNLVLGRANGEPQSNFARFKAGDLSIYEKYLNPQDIDKLCGFSKPQKPNSQSANYMQARPGWNSPVTDSYPRTQPGFLKSDISGPERKSQNAMNVLLTQKKTQAAINAPYFSSWSSWTVCSKSCGLGTSTRQRSCIYTHAQSGWQTCHGVTFQAKKCALKCPVVREHVQASMPRASRKDSKPASTVKKNTLSNRTQSQITKPVVTSTKSIVNAPKDKEATSAIKKKANEKHIVDVAGARRNRISKIISKLVLKEPVPSRAFDDTQITINSYSIIFNFELNLLLLQDRPGASCSKGNLLGKLDK